MRIASIALIILGCATGFYAAHSWKKASDISPIPGEFEPPETEDKHGWSLGGIQEAFQEAARLNKVAARWTAVSVGLSAVGGLLAILGSWVR